MPYENFVRLQLMLGEDLSAVSGTCRSVGVPCPSLEGLGAVRSALLDSLPASCQEEAVRDGLSQAFLEKYIKELKEGKWEHLQCLLQFATRQTDFERAWEFFTNTELRLRIDCLVISQRCDPTTIAETMAGWSKYPLKASAVEVYSYFFCNMDAMQGFRHWQRYFRDHTNEDHQYYLCQAFDVQTDADLLVLASDLNVRSAIRISPEDTVKDLLASAYVQVKKEEKKIKSGVPAKNTAIFEWSSVFCGMYDRVQKSMEAGGNENALENVRTTLVKLQRRRVRRLDEFEIAQPDGPQGEVA